ncbi:MAG: FmdE family protein [Halobacteriota archaeon]
MSISLTKLEDLMERYGTSDRIREYIRGCVSFHSFAPPGLLIGVFMVDLGLEVLGVNPGAKLYAVAETSKCAPDAIQVITHSTIGNHRLRILETGKFAITLNKPSQRESSEGVRIYIDEAKIRRYPTLTLWYTNDPAFKHVNDRSAVYDDIIRAGRDILSWELVSVRVSQKRQWEAVKCPVCCEMVPDYMFEHGMCRACAGETYYERSTGPQKTSPV